MMPQFDDVEFSGIKVINEFYVKKLNDLKKTRDEFYKTRKLEGSPAYYIDHKPHYIFSDKKYLSVLSLHEMYAGGVRVSRDPEADNFDIVTGKKITLQDIFKSNDDIYMSKIEDVLSEYLKSKDGYDEFYKHLFTTGKIKSEYNKSNFFLSDRALTIFYDGGKLSPLNNTVFFEIPFELLNMNDKTKYCR